MRKCPFDGCNAAIADSLFACRKHWFRLSAAQRFVIHQAYADYMADEIEIGELRQIQQSVLDALQVPE